MLSHLCRCAGGSGSSGADRELRVPVLCGMIRVDARLRRDARALAQVAWASGERGVASVGAPHVLDVRPEAHALNRLVALAHVDWATGVGQVAIDLAPIIEVEPAVLGDARSFRATDHLSILLQ